MRKQDTFSLFFSGLFTSLLHLFEILSVARFPHCFLFHLPLLQNVLLNLQDKVRSITGMKEQSVETPWEMKQERLRALYFLFCNLIILDLFLHLCTAWQLGVGFCMLFTVILPSISHIANQKFLVYFILTTNNEIKQWSQRESDPHNKWQHCCVLFNMTANVYTICGPVFVTILHACMVTVVTWLQCPYF